MTDFNIFTQTSSELQDFFGSYLHIAGKDQVGNAKYLSNKSTNYTFNQWETVNKIMMYYNSQFESGKIDSEGQQKVFLNVCAFRADVASKQVDIDVKNFVFIPEMGESQWGAYFMQKRFQKWAKESFFGEVINQTVMDFPKFGTAVEKRVGNKIERVPLMNLRNQQDCKDLQTATYVIEEHKDMTYEDMAQNKEWNLEGLQMDFDQTVTVYERYGMVPLSFYKTEVLKEKPNEEDYMRSIDTMSLLILQPKGRKKIEDSGHILFMEKCKKRPYEEVHWKKEDGRWLGVGEIENQFENQKAQNIVANMQRKSLYWSSKRLWQTRGTEAPRNLARNVHDGEVLMVGVGGEMTPIDMASRNTGEFNSFAETWEKNSDQKSFTFEVATGESLPSGTPFRLGVVLSNAVNSHFALKREQLGLFFKRLVQNQLLEVFKKENRKAHILTIASSEDGAKTLMNVLTDRYLQETLKETILSGKLPDVEGIKLKAQEEMAKRQNLFIDIPDNFYDEVYATVELEITGESVDIPKRIETLTNLYNTMAQKGDPRADQVLSSILALSGENMDSIAGPVQQQAQQQQAMQTAGQSALAVPQGSQQTV